MFQDVVRGLCERFARKLPTWVITVDADDPYLARHYVFQKDWIPASLKPYLSKVPSIFFHEFLRGDSDDELHNHPWKTSFSIVLAGGYMEERASVVDGQVMVITRTLRPGMVNVILANDFHRVTLLDDKTTWTLFFAGERTGELWGFLDVKTQEFLNWKEHMRRRQGRVASGYSKIA